MSANRIAPDGMPRFAASHLGLLCLPMSHKRTPGLYALISTHVNRLNEEKRKSVALRFNKILV